MHIFLLIFLLWTLFFFVVKSTEIISSGSLSRSLRRRNITFTFGYICIYTTRFNNRIETFAATRRSFLIHWFGIGAFLGLIGLILSVFLLLSNLALTLVPPDVISTQTFSSLEKSGNLSENHVSRLPFHKSAIPVFPRSLWSFFAPYDRHSSSVTTYGASADLHFVAAQLRRRSRHHSILQSDRSRIPWWHFWRQSVGGGCMFRHKDFHHIAGRVFHSTSDPSHWHRDLRKRYYHHNHYYHRHRHRHHHHHPHHNRHHFLSQSRHLLALPPSASETSISSKGTIGVPTNLSTREAMGGRFSFLTPLVPGITVPSGDVWFMVVAVLVAAVVHELGHALAAGAEYGQISGLGAFIAVLLPGAFVRLSGIDNMSPRAQLRVYCAGAWHNVVSAIFALAIVFALPILLAPGYVNSEGAMVVAVPPISPLYGSVTPGDLITRLGAFPVHNGGNSFREALSLLESTRYSTGFCVARRVLLNESHPSAACCESYRKPNNTSSSLECFRVQSVIKSAVTRQVCLDLKLISTNANCRVTRNCYSSSDEPLQCIVPVLHDNKQLIDMRIKSVSSRNYIHLFYEGFPHILGRSITVSSYVPRLWKYLPSVVLKVAAAVDFPNILKRFLQYLSSISLGLALLNMAPVMYLDGEASVGLFVKVLFKNISLRKLRRIRIGILTFGSTLLVVNLAVGMWIIEGIPETLQFPG